MQILLSFIFAICLVAAQISWKVAVARSNIFQDPSLNRVIGFVFSPLVLLGILIYVIATALYMYLLSKYQFSTVQSLAIPLSLIFSIMAAIALFSEKLNGINYVGIVLLVIGIILVTQK